MKKLLGIALTVTLLVTSASAEPVAWVQKLYGAKNLSIKESDSATWYRAHLDQNAEIGNHFKTDQDSLASIMFFLGGKAVLDKGCEIKIISERDVDVMSQGVELKSGTFWAKFDKQKEAPIRIKTAGGVMGIRGTEFVVQVDDKGFTKLSLLEGDVVVEDNHGASFDAKPGNEVTFGPNEPLLHRLYKLEELNGRLRAELGPAFQEMREGLHELRKSWRENNVAVRSALLQAEEGLMTARLEAISGSTQARNAAVEGLDSARPGLESAQDALKNLDSLLNGLDSKGSSSPGPSSAPRETVAEVAVPIQASPHPTLAWELGEGDQYAVLFLDPEDDQVIHWADETPEKTYTHPSDAKPLEPGEYRFRVVPLNREGEVVGEALEGRFRIAG